ncbi:TIGR02530 family flagellar biosynthesis protein [Paenibacillus silvisoli]|uniref:TIGR02530 family flagellar biosynthesis protein n=1 Tax=Paenibacillus silvisoli TaxID=3110539 RepID=UPI00280492EC|nr:TIGR02530 family flagellar biosynthesis protein [Paenibacillus silvisoli]
MDEIMKIGHLRLTGSAQPRKANQQVSAEQGTKSFQSMLDNSVLNFSSHAEIRMAQRGISFKPETLSKIVTAIDQAAAKGAKDSLVVYRDIAMIVNVPSRTVVTAMDGSSLQGNVFTKIDSAVIVS